MTPGETIERFFDRLINAVDPAGTALLHDDFTMFAGPTPGGRPIGPQGFLDVVRQNHVAFPDWTATIEEMVVDGDAAVTRWTARATHQAPFQGIAATGKAVTVKGVYWHRFRDGKIAEHRTFADMLGLMVQLGAVAPPKH